MSWNKIVAELCFVSFKILINTISLMNETLKLKTYEKEENKQSLRRLAYLEEQSNYNLSLAITTVNMNLV
jgi:hypothetical protein